MFPTYVALVPFEKESDIPFSELAAVAAALQIQVVRDFGPLWDVCGAVAPFPSLEDVPPEYIPLAIVKTDLPLHREAFHFSLGGTPFGLVRYQTGWSLAASHETLEIICDQSGQRTMPGPSLDPKNPGTVDYLVETCDPCEHSTYEINGITVSDFVTPDYYNATDPPVAARFSFTGRITEPRQLLGRGYVSWHTRLPGPKTFQAFGEPATVGAGRAEAGEALDPETQPAAGHDIVQITGVPAGKSRAAEDERNAQADTGPGPHYGVGQPYAESGDALRNGINQLLVYIDDRQGQPISTVTQTVEALEKCGSNGTASGATVTYLKEQQELANIFGPDLFDPGLALWMCMHIA